MERVHQRASAQHPLPADSSKWSFAGQNPLSPRDTPLWLSGVETMMLCSWHWGEATYGKHFPENQGEKIELSYAVEVSSDTRTSTCGTGFVDQKWGRNGMALLGGGKVYANVCTLETSFLKVIENGEMRGFWELGRAIFLSLFPCQFMRQGLMETRLILQNLTYCVGEDELEFGILLPLFPEN